MCINHPVQQTPEVATAEKTNEVAPSHDPLASSSPNVQEAVPMSMRAPIVSQYPNFRRHIEPPIPRDSEGIRYGGCDF